MPPKVRVALAGCGKIARVHCSYLREVPQAELAGLWDIDPGARRALAAESGAPSYESLDELLERARPDVCHVLTPPPTHAPLACELLERGVNVLVEKPFAMSGEEADALLAAARRSGRWVTVDHNRWFDPVVQRAVEILARGDLGTLVGIEVFQGVDAAETPAGNAATHWSRQLPGGVLHNLASHPLYLMRRFAGAVRELHTIATFDGAGMVAEVRLVGRGERALASVVMSSGTRPFTNRLTLFATRGIIDVNLNNMTLIWRQSRRLPKLLGKVWPNLSEALQLVSATARNTIAFAAGRQRFYPGIGAHLRSLYARVARGESPPVEAEEGRDVVVWYDEILAQAGWRASSAERARARA